MSAGMLFDLPPVADGRGLYPIANRGGGRLWCGPAALAAVSGWDAADTQEACNLETGRRTRGLRIGELERAAARIGVKLSGRARVSGGTLREWAASDREPGCYIVLVTDHYVVVNGARFVDSRHHEGCAVRDAWCAGRHVKCWWKVLA
jgi:hypothetical protein